MDEQESIELDKNDIEEVVLFEDLSIKVGVRSYIPNPEIVVDDNQKYLLDYNAQNPKCFEMSHLNICKIKELR